MIIRNSPRQSYTSLPNALLSDRRLSLDTRGMLAYLLSLPPRWEIRPALLAKKLSADDARPIGRERLQRMFGESLTAGYMARSEKQAHRDDGFWGSYIYIVGADPVAVAEEVASQSESVAFLPQAGLPHTAEPHTANPHTDKRKIDSNTIKQETPPSPSRVLDGELLSPTGDISFDEFWRAIREEPGPAGPAMAAWRRLSPIDRQAIYCLVNPEKGISLDGMWACTWLTNRQWENSSLRTLRVGNRDVMAAANRLVDVLANSHGVSSPTFTEAKPYSAEWNAERDRLVAAGSSVKLMDDFARDGRSWTCCVVQSSTEIKMIAAE